MHVVFDLDGVLVDTREAVRQSYLDAGVEMPAHAWGTPWQSWLPGAVDSGVDPMAVHADKTERYLSLINDGAVIELPPFALARKIMSTGIAEVGILTGASRESTERIMARYNFRGATLYGTSMTPRAKEEALRGIASRGVYIDDHEFADVAGWRIIRYDHAVDGFDGLVNKLWTP